MKMVIKSLFTSALVVALMAAFSVPVLADQNVNQSGNQNGANNWTCTATSGDYGQSTNNCYSNIYQNQTINQIQDRNIFYKKHAPKLAATAVDQTMVTTAIGMIVTTGAGALITLKKMRG